MRVELLGLAVVWRAKAAEERGLAERNGGHDDAAAYHKGRAAAFEEVAAGLDARADFLQAEEDEDLDCEATL